jgi:hypothetical protein
VLSFPFAAQRDSATKELASRQVASALLMFVLHLISTFGKHPRSRRAALRAVDYDDRMTTTVMAGRMAR